MARPCCWILLALLSACATAPKPASQAPTPNETSAPATRARLLELRQQRAATSDPARRAELDLESADVLLVIEGPGPARVLLEALLGTAPPAQAAQASARLGAIHLQQGQPARAGDLLEQALAGPLPTPVRLEAGANLALARAVLEPSAERLAALGEWAGRLEAGGRVAEAESMRRNQYRLGYRSPSGDIDPD